MFRGMVSLCKIFKLVHWHLVLMGQWKLLPGFSSKVRTVGKRNSEHSVDKGKGNHRDVMNSGVDRERLHIGERSSGAGGLVNQLDDPGPLRGSNLLSVSATDVEESMMALHAMDKLKTRSNGVDARELDELEEHVDNLLLEDGTCENNDIKNGPKSRDKLYMAPVTHPDRYADSIDFWRNVYGIDSAV